MPANDDGKPRLNVSVKVLPCSLALESCIKISHWLLLMTAEAPKVAAGSKKAPESLTR